MSSVGPCPIWTWTAEDRRWLCGAAPPEVCGRADHDRRPRVPPDGRRAIVSSTVTDLCGIVKAYDVRGVVGEQFDDALVRDIGGAQPACSGRGSGEPRRGHRLRHAGQLAGPGRRVRRGRHRRRASTSRTSAWPAPTCSTSPPARWTRRARCSPPATTRPATTGSSCAAPARRPIGQDTGLATIREAVERRRARGPRRRHRHPPGPARGLRRLPARAGRPLRVRPLQVVVDAGNGMGGYTVPAVLGRRCRSRSCRCTSSSTATSPTTRPTRSTRTTWSTCRSASSRRAPTSGWPSTATPTAASSSTSAASRSARARSPRWSPSASWRRRPAARSSTT